MNTEEQAAYLRGVLEDTIEELRIIERGKHYDTQRARTELYTICCNLKAEMECL